MQSGVTRPLRAVFTCIRRAEERHYSIAGVLIHCALEAVNAVGEEAEEAVHDPMPLLWIQLRGDLDRPLHVGEEHRHLFALALAGRTSIAGSSRRDASGYRSEGRVAVLVSAHHRAASRMRRKTLCRVLLEAAART